MKEGRCTNGPCFHADQLNEYNIENCTEPGTYDFFSNSSVSFIFTFLGVSTLFCGKNPLTSGYLVTAMPFNANFNAGFITLIVFKIQFKDKKSAKENVAYRKVEHSDDIDIIHTGKFSTSMRVSYCTLCTLTKILCHKQLASGKSQKFL